MTKTALITGIGGQDGAYLAKFLLDKGYRVVGGRRRAAADAMPPRLVALRIAGEIEPIELDLGDPDGIDRALARAQPDEVYNLAAQSHIGRSFEQPLATADAVAIGALRLLDALRRLAPSVRFCQASSSEMFGRAPTAPQDEATPFAPRSPYGIAKLFAHWATVNYRETYYIGASSAILFNHESPMRGREFVTRKITSSLAMIRHGELDLLKLGNLDAQRDWGFAGDYVEGMWLMLQQKEAQDFVLATGEAHSVRNFVAAAAGHFGFDLEWSGNGPDEAAIDRRSGRTVVIVDRQLYRPVESGAPVGDAGKARDLLGWQPRVGFAELVGLMAEADDRRVADRLAGRGAAGDCGF